jgi:protoheme IX farnesyltransferase
MELAKSRLSALVVLTGIVGFVMADVGSIDWIGLIVTAIGVALAAGSANAFNQVLEVPRDARMKRTQSRPLPSGRISMPHAVLFAAVSGMVGVAVLALFVNGLAAGLAALNIALYVGVYTPMKVRTTMNTVVGAVVGAIPPMIGWAGATGSITAGAWVLGAILFVWQMPHFLALAWMYRDEYEKGGYRMLPSVDRTGKLTCAATMLYALALLPVGAAATLVGIAGWWHGVGAILLGGWIVYLSIRMWQQRTVGAARKVFIASVIYLPLLMGLLVFDRTAADIDDPALTVSQSSRAAQLSE